LVSVVCCSPFFRSDKRSAAFREWLAEECAEVIEIPEGEFKASGTSIATKIIRVEK
jgi:hypothetical protein